ncbi:nitroreductase family protein [Desulfopila sp. IMCC35008]|uniref:nitroreductase family protein n=1 Tax=Desulfopila sp. IMCC35008 TaxID=2653858 RepID=UPI0013D028EA|nr:nitroreductase family protein [Desulfopila sp. IMCC35008]
MLVSVDFSKCNKDGLCVLECPARILEMQDNGPFAIEGAEDICIQCGHCVAICPEAAISLDFLSPDDCMEVDQNLHLPADHVEHFLKSRRSIRTYKKKPVPVDLLEKALSIASYAPTGSNRQSVRWLVIHDQKDVHAIGSHVIDWMRFVINEHPDIASNFNMPKLVGAWEEGIDRICRDAPHLIFAYALKENTSGKADCDTALAYLELTLPSLGLGSCWAGYATAAANQWPPLTAFLKLEDDHLIHGAVMAGYPKFAYKRIPTRNKADIVYLK